VNGIEARFRLELGDFALDAAFRLPGRGVAAIFGPSGAGKSTLLRCVAGLERATRGYLEINGALWEDTDAGLFVPTHRRSLGYVLQEPSLFPHLSVRQNLRYGAIRRRADATDVNEEQAIAWLGIDGLLDRRPGRLSGGEKQRVAIARALFTGPRLLLLDEPLAGLDEASKAEILPYLDRLHHELSIPALYVSHSRGEVMRLADRVVLLDAGRVRAVGPVDEVSTLPGVVFGRPDEIGAIAEGTVAGHDAEFGLTYLDFVGGRLSLPADAGLQPGNTVRVQFLARDISLTRRQPEQTSILNILAGRVTEIRNAESTLPIVAVDVGGALLLARITRKSLVTLALEPGVEVFAQIKGVALLT
jgi:molybdate transport system ATP-binding protein